MNFSLLGDELKRKLKKNQPLKKQLDASGIVDLAQEVLKEMFGDVEGAHAKPLFLKNRTLTISCASTVIAQEIRLNQKELVERINKKLGTIEVDRIRYLA